jgi:uroporphyrinogen-III synthase
MLEIKSLDMTAAIKKLVMNLDEQDLVIFISKNAVTSSMPLLEEYWPQWPLVSWFAIGKSTARKLDGYGINAAYPKKGTSEDLLALPGLRDVKGLKVVIVRGQGGRETLAQVLTERGARVSYLETYFRSAVDYGDTLGRDLSAERIDICVVSSLEGLDQLSASLNESELGKLHLIVPSGRVAAVAGKQGWASVSQAQGADDDALLQSIMKVTRVL